jgi:hypothetical protein
MQSSKARPGSMICPECVVLELKERFMLDRSYPLPEENTAWWSEGSIGTS